MFRVRTTFEGIQGSPWLNTLYFDDAAGTAQQAATAAGTFWGAVDALMDSECVWSTEAEVAVINPLNGDLLSVEATTPVTGAGSLVQEALPIATQGLVRWRTGVVTNGREVRGRTFIPALCDASNDNGSVIAATVTAVNLACTNLLASASAELHIWHRPNELTGAAGSSEPVITGTMWTNFAVLRSRRD